MSLPLAIVVAVLFIPAVLVVIAAACMAPIWTMPLGAVVALLGALMCLATSLAYGEPPTWANIVLGAGMGIMLFGAPRILTEADL